MPSETEKPSELLPEEIYAGYGGWFIPFDSMSGLARASFEKMMRVIKRGGQVDVVARCDGKDYRWECDGLKYAKKIPEPSTLPVERGVLEEVRDSVLALNKAIDFYWNDDRGLRLTGMGEAFVFQITNAQSLQREALAKIDLILEKKNGFCWAQWEGCYNTKSLGHIDLSLIPASQEKEIAKVCQRCDGTGKWGWSEAPDLYDCEDCDASKEK